MYRQRKVNYREHKQNVSIIFMSQFRATDPCLCVCVSSTRSDEKERGNERTWSLTELLRGLSQSLYSDILMSMT